MRVELLLLALLAILPSTAGEAGHSAEDELAEALLAKYDTTKSETLNEAALIAMIKGNTLTTASFKALPAEDHTAHTGAAHSEEDELAEALLKKYGAADKMTEAQIITMIKANALTTASFKALPQDAHAGHDHSAHSAEDELAEALLGRYDADKTTALSEAEIINMIKGSALTSKTFPALAVDAHAGHGHRVLAEDAHSEEEELAEALLLKYDAAPKTGTLSEAELIVMIKGNKLTTKSFPALGAAETPTTPTAKSQWTDNAGLAFIGTLITCAASLAGAIIVLPLSKSCTKKYGRSGCNAIYGHLAALTTGVLLAAVFVHILPEANTMAGNKPHDWVIGSCFLGGVFTCFIVRFCVNACAESAGTEPKNTESAKNTESEKKGAAPGTAVVPLDSGATAETAVGEDIKSTDLEAATIAEDPDQCIPKRQKSFAVNIIVGDAFHNLSDGMLIAVAFSACPSLGWLVVGSILLHELPQEILDFAMLISTGMEWKWALAMNFLSSLTALVSCIIVLALGTRMSGAAQGQLLGFGSGTLTFIALSECFEMYGSSSQGKPRAQLLRAFLMICGMLLIGIMQLWHPECYPAPAVTNTTNGTGGVAIDVVDPHAGHGHRL